MYDVSKNEGECESNFSTYGLAEVLTVDEVAKFLKLNRKTLYAAITAKEVPARRIGKRVVIFRDALLQWLACEKGVLVRRKG